MKSDEGLLGGYKRKIINNLYDFFRENTLRKSSSYLTMEYKMKIVKNVREDWEGRKIVDFQGVDDEGKRLFGHDAQVSIFEDTGKYTVSFGSCSGDIVHIENRIKVINAALEEAKELNK